VTGRRGRRRKQVFGNPKDRREYCKLTEDALDRTVWRTGCGSGCGPVVKQTAGRVNVRVCPVKYIYL